MTGCGIDGTGFESERGEDISLLQNFQASSGALTATHSMGAGLFPGLNQTGYVADGSL